jgi:hypothetical protein
MHLSHGRNIPMRRSQRAIAALAVSTLLAACGGRRTARATSTPVVPPEPGTYIDLQPGSSLIVVSPLQRSSIGSLTEIPTQTKVEGTSINITLTAGPGFIGYERSCYSSEPAKRRRSRALISAKRFEGGKLATVESVIEPFHLPRTAHHVRLVYLIRASKADHDMAVIGAPDLSTLNAVTREVQAGPADGCRTPVCQWIPAAIAVRPEKQPGCSLESTPAI